MGSKIVGIIIPFRISTKTILVLSVFLYFVFGLTIASAAQNTAAQNTESEEERKVLETQLVELENQISKQEDIIVQYKTRGKNLQAEIKRLEAQIAKFNLQIKAINLNLSKLDVEIVLAQKQIVQTEDEIDLNKKNLSQLLQLLYENGNKSLLEIIFKNPQLSDFFGDLNDLMNVQSNLRIVTDEIIKARQKLVDQKEILALERSDVQSLKDYQDVQRTNIQKNKTSKNGLLKTTKGKEVEYQKILVETKKTAAEIRKQIFKFLGGGELKFEEAYKLVQFTEKATGVRAALILAVLDRESALGKNVGRCDYKTAMHPTRDRPVFLQIIKELNLEKDLEAGIIKVSCPNADGAYGGAMGPAQFIPSTWKIYKHRIAEITGNNPSSPWNNADAFVATALYLKDAGAGQGASLADERKAAAKYYAGSRWSNYLWTYGGRVITQAQKFEEDIAILSS